jgi:class 3 adenylate cyclase
MQERRLAAIMFTDIVGYTALIGSDEDRAFDVLAKNREIVRPKGVLNGVDGSVILC